MAETKAELKTQLTDLKSQKGLLETVKTLIQGSPNIDFTYRHKTESGEVTLDTAALREVLGEGISLAEPEILAWIGSYLDEQYEGIAAN